MGMDEILLTLSGIIFCSLIIIFVLIYIRVEELKRRYELNNTRLKLIKGEKH